MERRTMRSLQIPPNVFIKILVLLSVKILLRCKSVCKEWYTLISSHVFIQLHLQKSLEPNSKRNCGLLFTESLRMIDDVYHPSKIKKLKWPEGTISKNDYAVSVGLGNGLACFRVAASHAVSAFGWAKFFIICNPSTRSFKKTPPPFKKRLPGGYQFLIDGFGYNSEHDDYKIVITSKTIEDGDVREMLIYSLKANSWRCVSPTPSSSGSWNTLRERPVFGNNMLHYGATSERVARFDLCLETWMDDLQLPVSHQTPPHWGVLDGWIYQFAFAGDNEGLTNFWIMEKQVGKESSSWIKMFSLPRRYCCHTPITRSKEGSSGFVLLLFSGEDLTWYDLQENASVPFELQMYPIRESVEVCIGSLDSRLLVN